MIDDHADLLALLRGELSNGEVLEVASHLDTCEECRREFSSTAVGHALLSGAARTVRTAPTGPAEPAAVSARPSPAGLRSRSGPRSRPLILAAAAVALVVGTAAATHRVDRPDTPPPELAATQRTAELEPVEGAGSGQVLMAPGPGHAVAMTIQTRDLPAIRAGQFYYVWLFNPTTEKMLPLGVIGPDGVGRFVVTDTLVGRYQVVDVSLQRDDGDPAHSVTSVLRATYA